VTRKGPEGSNPSPGAYFEEPSASLKALAGESRIETTTMDELTAKNNNTNQKSQTTSITTTVAISSQLDGVIDSITQGMSRKAINTRLKMLYRISPSNASIICEHILSEQTERNIKTSTAENKVKALLWLTRFLKLKPFEQMTKQDILSYLDSLRKPQEDDPQQKWIGSYNNRLRVYIKFFKWLYNKDESDHRKRISPPCIQGVRQLPRQDKSPYKPTDLWDNREHATFLKYCPDPRDRCYHAMAIDMSARPSEILNLKIKDITFKVTDEGIQYAEVLIRGGKTKPRTLPLIDSIPYLKEWIQKHPTGDNKESWLFVSLAHANFGQKLNRDSMLAKYQYRYKASYFPKLLQEDNIVDEESPSSVVSSTVPEADKSIIRNMLTKPWNLYVYRHSALTEKSQILTESTLRDHAGWTMTSKMPTVYLHYFGTESARKLLEAKGIIKYGSNGNNRNVNVLVSKSCPQCSEPNKPDAQFCIRCKMVLNYESYKKTVLEERQNKDKEIQLILQKHEQEMKQVREDVERKMQIILEKIDTQRLVSCK
jgi:integrase/predicted nucleic acid-binding Zn ribbon protein